MKNLLLSSFIAACLCSCSLGRYGTLKELPSATANSGSTMAPKPIFGDNFNSFLFKTNITAYGKAYSGLLITKQMQPGNYRVIFTTELGMKLFDFEFKDTAFTLHYCVEQFNRPVLLKTIQKDIEILLMNNLDLKTVHEYTDKKNAYTIKKIESGSYTDYYFIGKGSQHLEKIEHSKKYLKKTTFTFLTYTNDFPAYIQIQHHDHRLKIILNHLRNKNNP